MSLSTQRCPCCNEFIGQNFSVHKSSPTHLFNYYLWCYNNQKKSLGKDKEGIRLEVAVIDTNQLGLNLNYDRNKGIYTLEVKPNQLQLNSNTIQFRCCVYNDRREDIFLTAARTLDASWFSWCNDDKEKWQESGQFMQIKPKEWYNGVLINFCIESVVIGSYKIPFAFNIQSDDGKTYLTLCRTIILEIADIKEEKENFEKSPFTEKAWEGQVYTVPPAFKMRRLLSNYEIPLELSKHFNYGFQEWKGIGTEEYDHLQKLRAQMETGHVTKENYQIFFHNCLWLEEVVAKMMLRRYNMENVTMSVQSRGILRLQVPGLAEKRPSLICGDIILVRMHSDHLAFKGYIKNVEDKHINIQMMNVDMEEIIKNYPHAEMDVAFQLGRLPLERAHAGVDQVCRKGFVQNLFPDDLRFDPYFQEYKLIDKDFFNANVVNNLEQRTAVEKILNCSSQGAPYIVFGPPGTGKTVTIVEAICQILNKTKKRVLICAPANAACDMLTSKLIPYCTKNELRRVHSGNRDITTIMKNVQEYSNIIAGTFTPMTWLELMNYRIVVTTLILIGKFSNDSYCPDYIFIDEAAQATEAEACVALGSLKRGGNIILAGDPMQLGPTVNSKIAQEYEFHISLLERLMNTQTIYQNEDPNFITMLKMNFRSHPEILHLPNEMFYKSKLDAVSEKPRKDPISKIDVYSYLMKFRKSLKKSKEFTVGPAVEFCAVSAKEQREGRSPSYFNPAEANMVIEYIKALIHLDLPTKYKVQPSDIGVITPYVRQVYKIKRLLESNNIEDVEVGSTEAFQGREKRVIILSTVRAQYDLLQHDRKYALGFVKQEKRFNVALTRAVSKLIVIGCPLVLATDEKWKSFIENCVKLNSYHGSKFEERTNDKVQEIINRFQSFPQFSTT